MNRRHARAYKLNAQNSASGTHRLPLARPNAPDLKQPNAEDSSLTSAGDGVRAGAVDAAQSTAVDAVQAGAVDAAQPTGDPTAVSQPKSTAEQHSHQEKTESKKPNCIVCQRTELVGAGYAELIKDAVEVVGYTCDGQEGIDLCRKLQPALLITDMDLANIDGLELCRTLRYEQPSIKLLLLSDPYSASRYYAHFLNAGVNTFCLLTSEPQSLLDAIDRALKGEHYFDEKLKQWINTNANRNEESTRTSISKEFAVAELIAQLALTASNPSSTDRARSIND
jgi:DNA-binding NarL/FixJ family response regulator